MFFYHEHGVNTTTSNDLYQGPERNPAALRPGACMVGFTPRPWCESHQISGALANQTCMRLHHEHGVNKTKYYDLHHVPKRNPANQELPRSWALHGGFYTMAMV